MGQSLDSEVYFTATVLVRMIEGLSRVGACGVLAFIMQVRLQYNSLRYGGRLIRFAVHTILLLPSMMNEHWIHCREEHRMSPFLDVFAIRNQSRLNDRVRTVGASNVVDVLGEVVR